MSAGILVPNVNPLLDKIDGPLPRMRLNAFYELDESVQEVFLEGLELASISAFLRKELNPANAWRSSAEIADQFAASIDPTYLPRAQDNDFNTVAARNFFQRMIVGIPREELFDAVQDIKDFRNSELKAAA